MEWTPLGVSDVSYGYYFGHLRLTPLLLVLFNIGDPGNLCVILSRDLTLRNTKRHFFLTGSS